jgi:hypothetical protein
MINTNQQIFLTKKDFDKKINSGEFKKRIEFDRKVVVSEVTNMVFHVKKAYRFLDVINNNVYKKVYSEDEFKYYGKNIKQDCEEGFILTFIGLD